MSILLLFSGPKFRVNVSGTISPEGDVSKIAQKSFFGTVMSSGVVTNARIIALFLSGVIEPAGYLQKQAQKGLSGVIASSGVLRKSVQKSLSGVLPFTGAVRKTISTTFFGNLFPSGRLDFGHVYILFLSGVIRPAGKLRTLKQKSFSVWPVPSLLDYWRQMVDALTLKNHEEMQDKASELRLPAQPPDPSPPFPPKDTWPT